MCYCKEEKQTKTTANNTNNINAYQCDDYILCKTFFKIFFRWHAWHDIHSVNSLSDKFNKEI